MKSILQNLSTDTFARVRVGIGAKPENWDLADYVLSRPTADERARIDDAIRDAADAVALIVRGETDTAMSRFNKKKESL